MICHENRHNRIPVITTETAYNSATVSLSTNALKEGENDEV
jgi:hypothetical protein